MIFSLLYVSQSNLRPPSDRTEIKKIVTRARLLNKELNVTGALLCTAGRFAQILEGPEESIRIIMRSIESDPRHRNIKVLSEDTLPERRFPQWTLAYQGSSLYVDRHIKPLLQDLLSDCQSDHLITRLTELMLRNKDMERPERSRPVVVNIFGHSDDERHG